jgi:hypothetical protein
MSFNLDNENYVKKLLKLELEKTKTYYNNQQFFYKLIL